MQAHNSDNTPFAMKPYLTTLLILSPDFDYPARNFLSYHNSPKYYIILLSLLLASLVVRICRPFIKSLSFLRTYYGWNIVSGAEKFRQFRQGSCPQANWGLARILGYVHKYLCFKWSKIIIYKKRNRVWGMKIGESFLRSARTRENHVMQSETLTGLECLFVFLR